MKNILSKSNYRSNGHADEEEIDLIVDSFFAAFVSPESNPVEFSGLRQLFLSRALIVKADEGTTVLYDVDSFIEPREALLNSGRLLKFSEREVAADTKITGDIAQRWSLYCKSGMLDGEPYAGWGRKSLQFVRTPEGWRISAVVWTDGVEGSSIPSS